MASILDTGLVSVNFIDETNYITPTETDDVVGMVVDANWGPVMKPVVCDSTRFRSIFNPNGLGRLSTSMVSVHRCFAAGASLVEITRAPRKDEKWIFVKVSSAGVVSVDALPPVEGGYEAPDFDGMPPVAFRLRYMGAFPMAITIKDSGRTLSGVPLYNISVLGVTGATRTSTDQGTPVFGSLLETLQVTFKPLTLNGVSYFYADIIEANSQYLAADSVWASSVAETSLPTTVASTGIVLGLGDFIAYDYNVVSKYKADVQKTLGVNNLLGADGTESYNLMSPDLSKDTAYLSASGPVAAAYSILDDREAAVATILVNAFAYSDFVTSTAGEAGWKAMGALLCKTAESRKDVNALVGYIPTAGKWNALIDGGVVSETEVRNFFNDASSSGLRMFGSGMIAWERYQYSSVLGQVSLDMDGTALWAGRMSATAYALRNRNQLPSYKAYGRVSTSLVRSLTLSDAKQLHDATGVASIYSSVTGNYIFGIRNLYGATESYFARLNVTRVIAALLSGVYDLIEEVIHTDVAANRGSRLDLEARLQSYMGNMIARSELRPESTVDVGDSLNADVLTNGGRILRIHLICYFMSLTEKVEITVIARDNSVTTEITQ